MAASVATASSSDTMTGMTDPSHSTRRHHRNKKGSDPFLELAADDAPTDRPSVDAAHEGASGDSTSTFADLVLAPLTMVSFLLSLFLVDRQQRAWRLSQHSIASHESLWSRLTHLSWLDPQPYQDYRNSTWQRDERGASAQMVPEPAFQRWYSRKKHRAVAKLEIGDALEMRKTVLLGLAASWLVGLFAVYQAGRGVYGLLTRP
ncbi:uncharacterized protein LTR77_010174 [Saxophila tyrrhenica]|uniref:Uncharacterized protein n=1 Tax=Saxophila tyrrhenica TaxID=1690608 RepID=A0AAV9P027_9PEZI|nr:hypothetical protein LTR77_010174 [Saxophila tyrrhenica]